MDVPVIIPNTGHHLASRRLDIRLPQDQRRHRCWCRTRPRRPHHLRRLRHLDSPLPTRHHHRVSHHSTNPRLTSTVRSPNRTHGRTGTAPASDRSQSRHRPDRQTAPSSGSRDSRRKTCAFASSTPRGDTDIHAERRPTQLRRYRQRRGEPTPRPPGTNATTVGGPRPSRSSRSLSTRLGPLPRVCRSCDQVGLRRGVIERHRCCQ